MKSFKPENYNSLSAYVIADNAQALADMLTAIFGAKTLRVYHQPNGRVMHMELLIDDTVLMISDSTPEYPATSTMLHLYVPDVHATYERAITHGARMISRPVQQEGDPDTRGSFYDNAGNYWSVSSQANAD